MLFTKTLLESRNFNALNNFKNKLIFLYKRRENSDCRKTKTDHSIYILHSIMNLRIFPSRSRKSVVLTTFHTAIVPVSNVVGSVESGEHDLLFSTRSKFSPIYNRA